MAGRDKVRDYVATRGLGGVGGGLVFMLLGVWCAFSLFALFWVFYTSLKTDQQLFNDPWGLPMSTVEVAAPLGELPLESTDAATQTAEAPLESTASAVAVKTVRRLDPQWVNYKIAWTIAKVGSYTANSVIVTLTSVTLIVLISAMAAFAITKLDYRGVKLFFYYFLAGLAVPASLLLVPLFMFLKNFNIPDMTLLPFGPNWLTDKAWYLIHIRDFYLIDSRLGLILIYTTFGIPFTVFVLTGFFRTLPSALAEAAAIDGASEYSTFWKIYLPLAKPGLVTVAIFNFLFTWNEYQFALVFISNPHLKTLPLGLYSLAVATQHSNSWTALFAGLVILIAPTILIFLILEDRITRGLTVGAVKE